MLDINLVHVECKHAVNDFFNYFFLHFCQQKRKFLFTLKSNVTQKNRYWLLKALVKRMISCIQQLETETV